MQHQSPYKTLIPTLSINCSIRHGLLLENKLRNSFLFKKKPQSFLYLFTKQKIGRNWSWLNNAIWARFCLRDLVLIILFYILCFLIVLKYHTKGFFFLSEINNYRDSWFNLINIKRVISSVTLSNHVFLRNKWCVLINIIFIPMRASVFKRY